MRSIRYSSYKHAPGEREHGLAAMELLVRLLQLDTAAVMFDQHDGPKCSPTSRAEAPRPCKPIIKSPSSPPEHSGAAPNARARPPHRAHLRVRFDARCLEAHHASHKATASDVPADVRKQDAERMARIDERIAHAKAAAMRAAHTATAKPRAMVL